MIKLPIEGKGLDAIIRVTTGAAMAVEAAAPPSAPDHQSEERVGRLAEELERLRKLVDEEIPQGEAGELYLETLKEKAGEFDESGNLLDAFHLYRRALRIDPKNIDALYHIATIYYSAGLKKKAAECLQAVLEIDPSQERAAESLEEIENEF